jgi:hypothetical protein
MIAEAVNCYDEILQKRLQYHNQQKSIEQTGKTKQVSKICRLPSPHDFE